jgi:pimeloyl-ACP methyl ester carboxylesterase
VRRRAALPLAVALVAAAIAGCTAEGAEDLPRPTTAEGFRAQELRWGPCEEFARTDDDRRSFASTAFDCAWLTVPLDHDEPAGTTIRIGVLRHAAVSDRRVGALVVNPGGPGASGMSAAAGIARRMLLSELTSRFDLIGFDPRGVAASDPPLSCSTPAERDAERLDVDLDTSPAGIAATEAEEREFVQRCVERTGADVLARLGSRDVARDMDVLRAALGEPELTYLGYSYGTRIGTAYMAEFPENVRAMVLDGAVDPDRDAGEALVAQAEGFQRAFDAFAQWCAGFPECPLGPDPRRGFPELVAPLAEDPVPAGGDRVLGRPDAVTGTLQALYSPRLWESLLAGLVELTQGRGDTLLLLADAYHDRQRDGTYTNASDVLTAVRCVDDARTEPGREAEIDAEVRAVAPFLDDGSPPSSARGPCAFWPVPAQEPVEATGAGAPPAVVVSTTGDPATPYEAGVRLAEALGARLVTVEGTQHTAVLSGIACLDDPVLRYLVDPRELPPEGLRCPAG